MFHVGWTFLTDTLLDWLTSTMGIPARQSCSIKPQRQTVITNPCRTGLSDTRCCACKDAIIETAGRQPSGVALIGQRQVGRKDML
jgi:hypothetical protein